MSRRSAERLEDVLAAVDAIRGHTARGDLADGLVFDAVRVRLIEIGEAIKDLPAELLATEPDIPWQDIARMRDRLAHRYFDTSHAMVAATVTNDLPLLEAASVGWPSVSPHPDCGSRPEACEKSQISSAHTCLSETRAACAGGRAALRMLRGAGFKVVDWYGVVAKPQKGHPLLALRE